MQQEPYYQETYWVLYGNTFKIPGSTEGWMLENMLSEARWYRSPDVRPVMAAGIKHWMPCCHKITDQYTLDDFNILIFQSNSVSYHRRRVRTDNLIYQLSNHDNRRGAQLLTNRFWIIPLAIMYSWQLLKIIHVISACFWVYSAQWKRAGPTGWGP